MKKILIVIGTRPNFIKVTQFKRVALSHPLLELKVVHTGQHFDKKMAEDFFRQFSLYPDFFLNIDTSAPSEKQMMEIESKLKGVIDEYQPALLLVVGDVNSTLAAARAAKKMNVKLGHVESGLRSFDPEMPEEFNRIETDKLTDIFFVTEQSGIDNLLKEGKRKEDINLVGNSMIDTLIAFSTQIDSSDILKKLRCEPKKFVLMTIHRPANVDTENGLKKLLDLSGSIAMTHKIVFPIHPRTFKNIDRFGLTEKLSAISNLIVVDPLDYFSFQKLVKESSFILTDSGGIQEESTFLRVPCLTLRKNTERPITITEGTNELVPFDRDEIKKKIHTIENGTFKKGSIPALWDGMTTERILDIIEKSLSF